MDFWLWLAGNLDTSVILDFNNTWRDMCARQPGPVYTVGIQGLMFHVGLGLVWVAFRLEAMVAARFRPQLFAGGYWEDRPAWGDWRWVPVFAVILGWCGWVVMWGLPR